jgi:hypothetical protein
VAAQLLRAGRGQRGEEATEGGVVHVERLERVADAGWRGEGDGGVPDTWVGNTTSMGDSSETWANMNTFD